MLKRFWRKFKRFVTRDYSGTTEVYTSHGEPGKDFTPSWGIIIPHGEGADRGALTPDKKISETGYCNLMLDFLAIPFASRQGIGVSGAASKLKKQGCNASLEPHKNAYRGVSFGFEILVLKGDDLSIKFAEIFAQAFHEKFPERVLRGRKGVREIKPGKRGSSNLIKAKKSGMEVALLSESFFIDNVSEWINPEEMAQFWEKQLN